MIYIEEVLNALEDLKKIAVMIEEAEKQRVILKWMFLNF